MMISAPIIALMFILGTGSVLAFVAPDKVDLIAPIPQVLSRGFGSHGWVSTLVSITMRWLYSEIARVSSALRRGRSL